MCSENLLCERLILWNMKVANKFKFVSSIILPKTILAGAVYLGKRTVYQNLKCVQAGIPPVHVSKILVKKILMQSLGG